MDLQLLVICILAFVIHLIGTLAYAVRIAGIRTRRIAVSFALFNILILVSRTSNTFQGPFLAKRIEENIKHGISNGVATIMMFVFIDPQMSIMTDDVIEGKVSEPQFRRAVVWLVGSRFVGTLAAQFALVPAAMLVATVARVV